MAIMASGGNGGGFELAPGGLHQAVAVDVVDLGMLEVSFGGHTKQQRKVRISWQINEDMSTGKPFLISKRYTLSLHEKSNLRRELESWRGRAFTEDELTGFDLEKLIGANCQLNVQQVERNGKHYANIIGIVPLAKGMGKMEPRDYVRVVDREPTTPVPVEDEFDGPLDLDSMPF